MARLTKKMVIDEMKKVFDEHQEISDKLFELVKEGKVNSGVLLVHSLSHSYSYDWLYGFSKDQKCKLYGKQKHETKVSSYQIQLDWAKEELQKAKEFLADDTKTGWTKNNKVEER